METGNLGPLDESNRQVEQQLQVYDSGVDRRIQVDTELGEEGARHFEVYGTKQVRAGYCLTFGRVEIRQF